MCYAHSVKLRKIFKQILEKDNELSNKFICLFKTNYALLRSFIEHWTREEEKSTMKPTEKRSVRAGTKLKPFLFGLEWVFRENRDEKYAMCGIDLSETLND